MKTKFFSFIFLILIVLLSGCGGKNEATQAPTTPDQASEVNEAYPVQSEAYPMQNEAYPVQSEAISPYPEPQSETASQSTSGKPPENVQLVPSATPDPQKDVVIISNVTHSETGLETIMITNVSDKVQNINGYSLFIPTINEHINIFDINLEPGMSYYVYNGTGAEEQADGEAWLDTPILQQFGDEVILLNRAGRVIWTYVYYP